VEVAANEDGREALDWEGSANVPEAAGMLKLDESDPDSESVDGVPDSPAGGGIGPDSELASGD
jgi:hypothetical protein